MKKKSLFVCEECDSRNYNYVLTVEREKTLKLNKYCSRCQKATFHKESR